LDPVAFEKIKQYDMISRHLKRTIHAVIIYTIAACVIAGCQRAKGPNNVSNPISGTWQLISGTLIEKSDTTVTDYTKGISMIKIVNDTHFAFVNHDLNHGKDSTASFSAGGGRYELTGDRYTEFLEYCSAREWEGNEFRFSVEIRNDTLIQKGVEKIEDIGVERLNIEVYHRIN
jgi:predicted small secreted protein